MSPNLPTEKKRKEKKRRKEPAKRVAEDEDFAEGRNAPLDVGRWTLDEVVETTRDVDDGTSMNVMSHTPVVVHALLSYPALPVSCW